jgi:hypothetical protein
MKQRPILFNTEMVQAILAGRKTQTRRIIKPQPYIDTQDKFVENCEIWGWCLKTKVQTDPDRFEVLERYTCPYGKVGDVLWVRETWTPLDTQEVDSAQLDEDGIPLEEFQVEIGYKDGMSKWCVFSEDFYDQMNEDIEDMEQEGTKWKPSIHMPKDAARIWLRIKDVRVERLQDLSEDDALAEGIDNWTWKDMAEPQNFMSYIDPLGPPLCSAFDSFMSLWDKINGEESTDSDPFVWVIEFERIEKP